MKATSIVLTFLLTFALPALTQAPSPVPGTPPVQTDANAIQLTDKDRAEVALLQRDVEDAEVQAFQFKSKLDDANKLVESQANALNRRLVELRAQYKLAPDIFFNQQKLYFVKPPEKTPEAKK